VVVLPPGPEGRRRDQRKKPCNSHADIVLNDFYLYLFFFINFYIVTSNYILYARIPLLLYWRACVWSFLESGPKFQDCLGPLQWTTMVIFSLFASGPIECVLCILICSFLTYFLFLWIWDGLLAYFARKWMLQCCFKLLFNIALLDTQFLAAKQWSPFFYSPRMYTFIVLYLLSQGSLSRSQITSL